MLVFLAVFGVGGAVILGIWLYQKVQGRECPAPSKELTDALRSLQGSMRIPRKKRGKESEKDEK